MGTSINGSLNVKSFVIAEGDDNTGLVAKTGGVTATAGNITATAGDIIATVGDITATAGNMVITSATKGIVHTNSGTVKQDTSITTGVTLNTTSGVITIHATAIAASQNIQFVFTNSTIQADSVILVSINDNNTTDHAQLTVNTNTIAGGSCNISIGNPCDAGASSATAVMVHFLVINNS